MFVLVRMNEIECLFNDARYDRREIETKTNSFVNTVDCITRLLILILCLSYIYIRIGNLFISIYLVVIKLFK